MNISVFIGRRLSFKGSGNDDRRESGSIASAGIPIAIGGIALALVIMMFSVAVVTGFKSEIRAKVAGFNSQLTIIPQSRTLDGVTAMSLDTAMTAMVRRAAPGAVADGVVELPGILKTDSTFQGLMVKAYAPDAAGFAFIAENLTKGSMPVEKAAADTASAPARPEIVLSATIASKLGLDTGDKVDLHFVNNNALRTRRAVVSGIYDTHFGEYDARFIYATPEMARSVGRLRPADVTSIEINGVADDDIERATADLSAMLLAHNAETHSQTYCWVDNVLHTGASYFSWLDLLDTNVVVILVLMALVSGFTLISSLFILILERVRTIGILKSIGATNTMIRGIFIYMAERLVARGLLIGNLIGIPLLLIQQHWHPLPLDPDSYFLSYVPIAVDWSAIITLNLAVITISALILILPSHMIATLSPSESMRYE